MSARLLVAALLILAGTFTPSAQRLEPPVLEAVLEAVLDANGDYLLRWMDAAGVRRQARFIPADKIRPRIDVEVRRAEDGTFRYRYAIANDAAAEQSVGTCLMGVSTPATVTALPANWRGDAGGDADSRIALKMVPLPDGRLRGIDPGQRVAGFELAGAGAPGPMQVQCFGHVFPRLEPPDITPELERLIARIPGSEPVLLQTTGPAIVSPLVLLVGVGDYSGETYTSGPAPPAGYVFFQGEPVTMDVRIANWGSAGTTMSTRAMAPRDLFTIRARRNGVEFPLRIQDAGASAREMLSGSEPVPFASGWMLAAGDALRWRVALAGTVNADVNADANAAADADVLEPGVYHVDVEAHATDGQGLRIRRQAGEFTFEVRPRIVGLAAELARREAERWTAAGDFARARPAVARLEQLYPDSVAVHLIRSRIADAEGDLATYSREIDLAREFLRQDRDRLFRQFARPGQIEDLIDSLR